MNNDQIDPELQSLVDFHVMARLPTHGVTYDAQTGWQGNAGSGSALVVAAHADGTLDLLMPGSPGTEAELVTHVPRYGEHHKHDHALGAGQHSGKKLDGDKWEQAFVGPHWWPKADKSH